MAFQNVIRAIVPRRAVVGLRLWQVFQGQHGHSKIVDGMPAAANGKAQPWLTFPLIEYLNGLDFSRKDVFEFGAGASTLFWAERARSVTSVELDPGWHAALIPKLPSNATVYHEPNGGLYAQFPRTIGDRKFDVVVVDGAERYRSAVTALDILAPGGMIILDNAEWYPRTADMLATAGLIEVRFNGFSPINAFTATSSVFLTRDFAFDRTDTARKPPVGGRALDGGALDDKP